MWRRVLLSCMTVVLGIGPPDAVSAQAQDAHSVSVTVPHIENILVDSDIGFIVTAFDQAFGVDSDLLWETNVSDRKVQVSTALAPSDPNDTQDFPNLTVQPFDFTAGAAASPSPVPVRVGETHDLVYGVGRTKGGCQLAYRLTTTAADGMGSDVLRVTYTLAPE